MILPIVAQDRNEHQSSRPWGLVLHEALPEPDFKGDKPPTFSVDALEGQFCEISISHDGVYATAVALVPSMNQVE
jgi:holo-[acyl-carrier protein] synthase